MKKVGIGMLALILNGGCSTVYRGSTEGLTVMTPNCPMAKCTFRNKKGEWSGTTPITMTIPRSDDTIFVTCRKGDVESTYEIQSGSSVGTVAAEVILWGPFAAVNALTDGHREYPDAVEIPMVCK